MTGAPTATQHVMSRDGTPIGFLRKGRGPGIVLVQGAMADRHAYRELAGELSSSFTVCSVDRRGRGLSPKPYDAGHDIARDVEDVDAVLAATGAGYVFGLSSGAVITLEAARTSSLVTKAAVFEPPFYAGGISHDGIRRLDEAIERGDLGAALVEALRTSGTAPAPLRMLPRPLARLLGRLAITIDDHRRSPGASLRDLLPGVRYDFAVVGAMDGKVDTFAAIDKPVLVLSGTDSPAFLRHSARTLTDTVPHARHVELHGLGHDGPWNTGRGGHPRVVATALREFFAGV